MQSFENIFLVKIGQEMTGMPALPPKPLAMVEGNVSTWLLLKLALT